MKKRLYAALALVLIILSLSMSAFAQHTMALNGKWRIALDGNFKDWPNKTGESLFWYQDTLPSNNSISLLNQIYFKNGDFEVHDSIHLPGSTDEAGIGLRLQPSKIFTPGLERKYSYNGAFWVQREVDIPANWKGKSVVLFLERTLGASKVFWDDHLAGADYGYAHPHVIKIDTAINPGTHRLTILINKDDNRYEQTGHQVTNGNGTSWNGIVGRIELQAHHPDGFFQNIQVYTNPSSASISLRIPVVAPKPGVAKTIRLSVLSPDSAQSTPSQELIATDDTTFVTMALNKPVLLWNEFQPHLYKVKCQLFQNDELIDEQVVTFGMRSMAAEDGYITINGKRTILRGTLECGSFPLTGYPAMSEDEWKKIFATIKAFGLNHVRFHTWCPPEAAFLAADQVGLYLQPELCGRPYAELERVLITYGNHPSFCMLSLNNEAFSHNTATESILMSAKNADPRHLYTCTSHPFGNDAADDFYVSAWGSEKQEEWPFHKKIVGITWGGGDVVSSCRFNTRMPETMSDFSNEIASVRAPVVGHEMGQWAMFPTLSEIDAYQHGVLQNTNYERIRDAISRRGLGEKARDMAFASGKFSALLYKEEIESVLRTPGYAGFQLLGLNDFQGQYISIVGMLDDMWQSKGLVSAGEHSQYCNAVVPLLRMEKRVWMSNETFTATVDVSNVSAEVLENARIEWVLKDEKEAVLYKGSLRGIHIPDTGLTHVGTLSQQLHRIKEATKLTVQVSISETDYVNSWDIWVYPARLPELDRRVIHTTHSASEATAWLKDGKKVLYLVDSGNASKLRAACFSTIFWNSIHKWPQKAHTMGVMCAPNHPVFRDFPTEGYSNWQWWDIAMNAQAMVMNDLPPDLDPLIGVVDSYIVNDKLAYLWEAKVGEGKLIVSSINFDEDMTFRPASRQLYYSLIRYMKSPDFNPHTNFSIDNIAHLLQTSF